MVVLDTFRQLSTPERLELLEALWSEMDEAQVASPAWHKEALAESLADFETGRAKFSDWNEAKKRLQRDLLNS